MVKRSSENVLQQTYYYKKPIKADDSSKVICQPKCGELIDLDLIN